MLGHLASAAPRSRADLDDAEVVVVNTCGFVEERQARVDRGDPRGGGAQGRTAGLRRLVVAGCMAQRFAARAGAPRSPRSTRSSGSTSWSASPRRCSASWAAGHIPDQRGRAAAVRPHGAAAARHRRRLRLPQGRRGLRQPVQRSATIPRDARGVPVAPAGLAGGRGAAARGRRGARAGAHRPGHDALRRGPGARAGPACARLLEALLGGDRRCRGSASCTPTRRPSTRASSALMARRAAAGAVPRHAAPARLADGAAGDAARRRRRARSPR